MTRDLERMIHEIPVKRISDLTKNIRKYDEQVDKCDIFETNTLAENIGSEIDFLKFSGIRTTEEQKQEIKKLEEEFFSYIEKLKKCRCVKKLEK